MRKVNRWNLKMSIWRHVFIPNFHFQLIYSQSSAIIVSASLLAGKTVVAFLFQALIKWKIYHWLLAIMQNGHDQGISSTVKLNVGGHFFTTSRQTLTKDPNSMLAIMFSGKFDMKPSEDGTMFIDRDGTHFRFILNYLRSGKLTLPEGSTALKELMEEAEFYQIQGILDELKSVTDNLTIVKLNVGGHHFTTSLQTLKKDPKSRLCAMFSGEHVNNSTFIIDRDGTHFRYILNYLRDGDARLPEDESALKELEAEAQFYQVEGILMKLSVMSEIITNEEHTAKLLSFLPLLDSRRKRHHLRLLFRASRDGFFAKTFHSMCDNKGPTVTIVRSGENIFGGFTEHSWNSKCELIYCYTSEEWYTWIAYE